MSFEINMMTSVTRPCFTTQHQTCKTKTDFFLFSDRSCPKTDDLGPHHRFRLFNRFRATHSEKYFFVVLDISLYHCPWLYYAQSKTM